MCLLAFEAHWRSRQTTQAHISIALYTNSRCPQPLSELFVVCVCIYEQAQASYCKLRRCSTRWPSRQNKFRPCSNYFLRIFVVVLFRTWALAKIIRVVPSEEAGPYLANCARDITTDAWPPLRSWGSSYPCAVPPQRGKPTGQD